jgi:hypothetical protein
MVDLFLRTASQGLQAFLPIAFGLAAFRRFHRTDAQTGIRWGLVAAAVTTIPAALLFQQSQRQSLWEATLAVLALGAAAWAISNARRERSTHALAFAAITVLFVVRQTMEIAAVFTVAAFQLRSLDAVIAIFAAATLTIVLAISWTWIAGRLGSRAFPAALRAFVVLFTSQLAMYVLHESAEARLLPWSEILHNATEPYGPDGVYGLHFAWLLIAVPLATALAAASRQRWPGRLHRAAPLVSGRLAAAACLAVAVVASSLSLRSSGTGATPAITEAVGLLGGPHVLFRHTIVDQDYGKLSIASLANPAGQRLPLGLSCDRVAYASERGICLQAARGVFTTYRAILFDRQFNTLASWALGGSPSRTRVSPDGRVGAITVFVAGHGYGTSTFSTRTTLVDTSSGDPLGDLEQFSTWRDGARIKAQDFNFWGVTFGRDANSFYATLGTGGKTYLVKGELGLRRLTVVHEGVECPSLSPDEKSIAFKKRVSATSGLWRPYVLDLASMTEHAIAETRNIDDQIEWLDSSRVLYALPRDASATTDVWVAPADGKGPAQLFVSGAESPSVAR